MRISLLSIFAALCWVAFAQTKSEPMYVGSAYYPNGLTEKEVEADAQLMKQAGFTVARLGDLVWDSMEPQEGVYDFSWLTDAVQILSKSGVKSFLATPTAAIPKWMYDKHPDIMQVTATGERKPFGKRRHACINHPIYRDYCVKIAKTLAHQFKNNSSVIAFQVDNELMAEEPYCYCSNCQKKFAEWLKNKYKTTEALNRAWNLLFWSQQVNSFDAIYLPRKGDNPSCFQNYQEFYSDCVTDFFNLQKTAIKAELPKVNVSHNICSSGFLYQLDLYKFGEKCDFMSIDNYPYGWTLENEYGNRGPFEYTPHMASMALSQMRGAKSLPFWVTEAQIGRTAGNQRKIVEPGTVRLWSLQEMAQGAAGISFFSFRTFPAGHEHVMVGVLDDDNVPRRRYNEAQQIATDLAKIRAVTGQTLPVSEVAVIRDFKNDWAFEDGRISMDFRYMREVFKYYRALRNASVTADLISSNSSFDKYKLIVVPSMVLTNDDVCQRLKQAAQRGATLLITCMTGLRNDDVHSFDRILHTGVEELAGVQIEEQHALMALEPTSLRLTNDTASYRCGLWYDLFSLKTAKPLGYYDSRFFKGKAALTRNSFGKGEVFYVGTVVDEKASAKVVQQSLQSAKVKPSVVSSNELVEITDVNGSKGAFVYVINYSKTDQEVTVSEPMKDAFTNEGIQRSASIKPLDFRIFRKR